MVNWSGFEYGSGMVRSGFVNHRSGMVNWSGFVYHGSGMVIGSGLMSRSGMVSGSCIIMSFTRVLHISNITRIILSHMVTHSLGTTIREQNVVLTIGCVPITAFFRSKMESSVVILDCITVVVMSGSNFVSGLVIRRSGSGMVSGSGFVNWSGMVNGSGFVNWSGMVSGSGFVNWVDGVDMVDGVVNRVSDRVVSQGQSGDGKD